MLNDVTDACKLGPAVCRKPKNRDDQYCKEREYQIKDQNYGYAYASVHDRWESYYSNADYKRYSNGETWRQQKLTYVPVDATCAMAHCSMRAYGLSDKSLPWYCPGRKFSFLAALAKVKRSNLVLAVLDLVLGSLAGGEKETKALTWLLNRHMHQAGMRRRALLRPPLRAPLLPRPCARIRERWWPPVLQRRWLQRSRRWLDGPVRVAHV